MHICDGSGTEGQSPFPRVRWCRPTGRWAQVGTVPLCLLVVMSMTAAETVRVGGEVFNVSLLAADDFAGNLDHWVVEGNATVEVRDGRLQIATPDRGQATVWYRQPFAGDQLICFTARVLPPQQASNINFFFCASRPDGGDFFATARTGAYAEYHQINNYTMTFTGQREGTANAPGYMRLRQNPGFHLRDENLAVKAEIETDYHIAIAKAGSLIRVFVNGQQTLRYDDVDATGQPQDLREGYAGFRTFWSRLWCDDFAVWRIMGPG